jgi:hypothetical protein
MMLPLAARNYVLTALGGTPGVIQGLLGGLAADDPAWDLHPYPERFSLREMLAHLADWEVFWYERATRTIHEEHPFLENRDENRIASDRNYAHADPLESLARFQAGRTKLMELLTSPPDAAWSRTAHREGLGDMTLEEQAIMSLAHDGYHTRQAAEWLELAPSGGSVAGVPTFVRGAGRRRTTGSSSEPPAPAYDP